MGFYKSSNANKPFPHVEKLRLQSEIILRVLIFRQKLRFLKGKCPLIIYG